MIKAVLLDLDDTLIETNTRAFTGAYLHSLAGFMGERLGVSPEAFIEALMGVYGDALSTYDLAHTLYERTLDGLAAVYKTELEPAFDVFYAEHYPRLVHTIKPRAETPAILDALKTRDLRLVVATNPALPETAVHQRMAAGGVSRGRFEFVTTMQQMHFGKPHTEYYAEILLRLNLEPHEVLMVGDDWHNDISGASCLGMHTYWVHGGEAPAGAEGHHGSWGAFLKAVTSGWLGGLDITEVTPESTLHLLAAYPAAVDSLVRSVPVEVLEQCPAKDEWSVRDVICHLRDYEADQNRPNLRMIVEEDNPFLLTDYDPWSKAHNYAGTPISVAFREFVTERRDTLNWLQQESSGGWHRPARSSIFGPTTLGEWLRFITEHDRTHYQQMVDAVDCAVRAVSAGGG